MRFFSCLCKEPAELRNLGPPTKNTKRSCKELINLSLSPMHTPQTLLYQEKPREVHFAQSLRGMKPISTSREGRFRCLTKPRALYVAVTGGEDAQSVRNIRAVFQCTQRRTKTSGERKKTRKWGTFSRSPARSCSSEATSWQSVLCEANACGRRGEDNGTCGLSQSTPP